MNLNIGAHLRALRQSRGYSLREAAARSGLSHGYIRDVEIGINRKSGSPIIPMPKTLLKFSEAYQANYQVMMQIAGHIKADDNFFELIEVELSSVLYVYVGEDNRVCYHTTNGVYFEEKTLHEFLILEENLESSNFFRVKVGTYVNLYQIRAFDESKGCIYFNEDLSGQNVFISWMRIQICRDTIQHAISKNTRRNMDKTMKCIPQFPLLIRNIIQVLPPALLVPSFTN